MTTPGTTRELPPMTRATVAHGWTRAQRWAASALEQHPYWLELRGRPNELAWPRICANCGERAVEQIVVKKAFRPRPRRHSPGAIRPYRIAGAPVPFCATCADEHRSTVDSPSMGMKIASMLFSPLMIPVVGSLWVASHVWDGTRKESLTTKAGLFGWGFFALMIASAAWSAFLIWQSTRTARLDPQTDVTLACDFSEDVSEFYERERRIYAMRNKTFAEAFASLNAAWVWTATDQARSKRLSMIVAVLMLLALLGAAGLLVVFEK